MLGRGTMNSASVRSCVSRDGEDATSPTIRGTPMLGAPMTRCKAHHAKDRQARQIDTYDAWRYGPRA
jgi:hypothetical protein